MSKRYIPLLLVLCLAGCAGIPEAEQIIEGPAIDIENGLRPGMQPQEVRKLLGEPDTDEVPSTYNPPVIREFHYHAIRLNLRFHTTKGLGYVEIGRRWVKAVYGYRYGDLLEPGHVDFGTSTVLSHFKTPHWSDAFFFYDKEEVEQAGRKVTVARVRSIVLEDKEIYGSWLPSIKFK
jgi:hypothetical protein